MIENKREMEISEDVVLYSADRLAPNHNRSQGRELQRLWCSCNCDYGREYVDGSGLQYGGTRTGCRSRRLDEEGEIHDLICDAESWWSKWFSVIRPWKASDIDNKQISWICIHGVLSHVRRVEFFEALVGSFGTYICSDDNVRSF
ncbi:unnamed protein product [Vicia faba]|uniref:Uncharacterized protein n=1 Tax=Vicia faba TaxID=3906 RepID=A0AAV1ARN3_VICFA|nr:unnamed protein product [Vicia faba]